MSYVFPPELDRLVREELATGAYASEDELLLEAVRLLRDRDEAIAGIREGLADLDAGRVRPLDLVDAELHSKHKLLDHFGKIDFDPHWDYKADRGKR